MVDTVDGSDVVEVELVHVAIALRRPIVSAHGTEARRELVLVRVVLGDGTTGWGECSALARPTYTAEYAAGAFALLRDLVVPAVFAGRDPEIVGHPMALSGLSTACTDARLRSRGERLADHLGATLGRPRHRLAVSAVIGRGTVDEVVARVHERVNDGVGLVKLKVTPRPADLASVEEVRRNWPDLALAVDGNGSLDLRSVSMLDRHDLVYVEQPAPADALGESAALAARLGCPVALDESVTSVASLEAAVALGAGKIVNVKPARLGGLRSASAVVSRALDLGAGVFVGGMFESGIGRAAGLALAAAPVCTLPTDLGPSERYFEHDLTEPIVADGDGRVVVPLGCGSGVVPDPQRLLAATIDRTVISR